MDSDRPMLGRGGSMGEARTDSRVELVRNVDVELLASSGGTDSADP
jgi:hypothetical protein